MSDSPPIPRTVISQDGAQIGDFKPQDVFGGNKYVYNFGGQLYLPPAPAPEDLQAAIDLRDRMPLDAPPRPGERSLSGGSRMELRANPFFIGRDRDLLGIARSLTVDATEGCPTVAICGLAGMGKTQLAVEFAHRYGPYFAGGVFWVGCADPTAVSAELIECGRGRTHGLPSGYDDLQPPEQMRAVRSAWRSPLPRLLVLDNCEDPDLLEALRPTMGGSVVLVTSRRADWRPETGVKVWPIDSLDLADGAALLARFLPDQADSPALAAIAEELSRLPLALHLAGSYLREWELMVTPEEYLAELRRPGLLAHPSLREASGLPTRYLQGVSRAFGLSYSRLNPADPVDGRALEMLSHLACLAPGEPVPWELLMATFGGGRGAQIDVRALGRLREVGLIGEAGARRYKLHRLVAVFVAASGLALDYAVAEAGALDLAAAAEAERKPLPAWLLPHLRHLAARDPQRADDVAARLCAAVGNALREQADYGAARAFLARALAIREQISGPEHPHTARRLNDLGLLLIDVAEYKDAQTLLERALAIREATLGEKHADTAMSMNSLGRALHYHADYVGAQSLYERALAVREAILGLQHADTAESLNDLAEVLIEQGHIAEARLYHERALAIREAVLGSQHPDTAMSLNNLAILLQDQGDLAGARMYSEQALAIREEVLGPQHPDTAGSLNSLAYLLQAQGDLIEARRYAERALAINETVLGPQHPTTASSLNNLAMLLQDQGDLAGARLYAERALDIYEAVLEPQHPDTAGSLNNLGSLLVLQGQYNRAQEMLERALAIYGHVFGPQHPGLFKPLTNLATVHLARGQRIPARRYLTRALKVAEAHPHLPKDQVRFARQQLAQLGGPLR